MNKLQKSKTLSLGRLATLSTIKENLRVKTTFQKNELPLPSPHLLQDLHRHDPNSPNGSSYNNTYSGESDSPPLLFSAISSYNPEKTLRSAAGASNEYAQYESSNNVSPRGPTSPHNNSFHGKPADLNVASHGNRLASESPGLVVRTRDGHEQLRGQGVVGSSSRWDEDSEPPLFLSKLQRLYNSRNNNVSEVAAVLTVESVLGKDNDGEELKENLLHELEDAEIERFQVRGIREEQILSSVSSRSSSALSSYKDDLEELQDSIAVENDIDEEYWSIPPRVPGLTIDRKDLSTGDKWVPRHPDLVRVNGYHPFMAEAPLTTLMHFGFLTPTSLHFVHNHGPVPHAAWDSWTIQITGLVKTPRKFTMQDLLLFPSRRLPVTLMCSGNRGKELSRVGYAGVGGGSGGINWGPGAVSTSVWGGAKLRDLLRHCGAGVAKNSGTKRMGLGQKYFVRLLGADRYGTSIPLEIAMDESRDVLLAYEQNMDLLTPDHGFPVRLIVPGFTAGRSVKWLQKIEISDQDSNNYYHVHENRMLPSHVEDIQTALSEGWMNKPEFVIGEMNLNSVISSPAHKSNILSAGPSNPMKEYCIRGYAYSGAGKKIARVEVSLDGGKSWKLCNIECPELPTKFGKYWCWCFWVLQVEVEDLSVSAEIVVRAWDCAMNTQPEVFAWNFLGVMNNCWYRVKIIHDPVIDEDEPPTITFEHPTQPGSIPGGWLKEPSQSGYEMEKMQSIKFRHSESSSSLDIGDNSPRTPRPWLI